MRLRPVVVNSESLTSIHSKSTSIADATSTSFASRFECRGLVAAGVVDHLIYRVPVLPIEKVTVTRQQDIVPAGPAIIGTASMYNPDEPGDVDWGRRNRLRRAL